LIYWKKTRDVVHSGKVSFLSVLTCKHFTPARFCMKNLSDRGHSYVSSLAESLFSPEMSEDLKRLLLWSGEQAHPGAKSQGMLGS
jgi:hypothetical protein